MSGSRILVVDDEAPIRRLLLSILEDADCLEAASAEAARERLKEQWPDVVLTDLRLPGDDGLALLREIRALDPDLPIIVMTAYGSIQSAVEAMKAGAFDYLTKPVELKVVRAAVDRAVAFRRLKEENRHLRERLGEADLPELVGESAPMRSLKAAIRDAAGSSAPVLVTGETGTGKGVVARLIHRLSERAGILVHVNCAALPATLLESELFGHARGAFTGALKSRKGKFLLADQGTLFLDEVGTLPLDLQAKILHALDDGRFTPVGADAPVRSSARIIAATNEDLDTALAEGRFRSDLYWRLNVVRLALPPLSARPDDIPLLATHILRRLSPDRSIDLEPAAVAALAGRPWPGNVRELENVLHRAVLSGLRTAGSGAMVLGANALGESLPAGMERLPLKDALARTERMLIAEALRRTGGHKGRAAELLGLSARMISYYLEKYPELEEREGPAAVHRAPGS